jgi:hypothetical protein
MNSKAKTQEKEGKHKKDPTKYRDKDHFQTQFLLFNSKEAKSQDRRR